MQTEPISKITNEKKDKALKWRGDLDLNLNLNLNDPSKLISLKCVEDKCRNFHHCKLAREDPFVVRRTSFR